jgi:hypothetical protein
MFLSHVSLSHNEVDFCGFKGPFTFEQWLDPTIQLNNFRQLRDALNKTGREIYYSICPHAHVPNAGEGTKCSSFARTAVVDLNQYFY